MIIDSFTSAIKHAALTPPPADLSWLAEASAAKGTAFADRIVAIMALGARHLDRLKARGAALREEMHRGFSAGEVQPHHLEVLGRLIEAFEDIAEKHAIEAVLQMKRLRKSIRQIENQLPDLKPLLRRTASEMKSRLVGIVEEYLDFALFLRALRAEHSPPSSPVVSFTNPAEMTAFLLDELGALAA